MAWPFTRLTTYVANSTPVIKAADLNSIQDAIAAIFGGTLSVAKLLVDAAGGQAVSLAAGTIAKIVGGALDVEGDSTDTGAALVTSMFPVSHRKLLWQFGVFQTRGVNGRIYASADGKCIELTVNAYWNGTQWMPDSGVATTCARLQLSYVDPIMTLQYLDSGGIAFNDAAWSTVATFGNTSGTVQRYNGEATAGTGLTYVEKVGIDAASTGAGAQLTPVETFTVATSGLYKVSVVASTGSFSDTVTCSVNFTDAVNNVAQSIKPINAVVMGTNATTSGVVLARAKAGGQIYVQLDNSVATTTRVSAVVERVA